LTYRPDANYNGEDTFFYRARDIDGSTSAAVAVNLTINPVNDPPRADAGARGMTINEGDIVAFDGSASTDVDGDPLEFTWYFGDGAVASGERVAHAFADNGAYKATLVVSDGACVSYDTIDILVNNAPPTAGLSGPASGVRGQVQTFSLSAKDPSPLDQQAGFRYSINWGDGTTETITGPGAASSGHVYAATGTYVVSMNAFDKDGAVSATAAQLISINAVEFQAGALVVGGTTGNDTIVVAPYDANGSLSVKINGSVLGVYAPGVTQILVYGQAGNDTIQIASNRIRGQTYFVKVDAMLFGDAGDDTLDARGSVANNVLIGGDGNDTLHGGANRDILLGGRGADILHGNGGDDLLVGNFTDWDANATALNALMAEWRRTDVDYATRANRLLGTSAGGKNGAYVLNGKTVHDDSAIDQLYGDAGQDMFLVAAGLVKDKTIDALGSELTATL
jgi:Ca2+-binding RTX toxin-like protein